MTDRVSDRIDSRCLNNRALFRSFFMGGFECSTYRSRSGRRLDLIAATGHDRHAVSDYLRMRELGMLTAREGLRWHLIEKSPGHYDFSSILPILKAASKVGIQVIWDLCHYGWPDDLDIFKPEFVSRFADLTRAFATLLSNEADQVPFICPINEISFFSWASGDAGWFYPFAEGRDDELKAQLVRAAIAGIEATWSVNPRARIVHTDPVINVIPHPDHPQHAREAEGYRRAQYAAWDMLAGRHCPELGGQEKYLDILGLNYYVHNQWFYPERTMISPTHQLYRPLREMLREVYKRYHRPMFIAETGIEDDARPGWFRYVCDEVCAAIRSGVNMEGICLYPIVNHPGWEDDRHCYNGLWDYANEEGQREIYEPLAGELREQMAIIKKLHAEFAEN